MIETYISYFLECPEVDSIFLFCFVPFFVAEERTYCTARQDIIQESTHNCRKQGPALSKPTKSAFQRTSLDQKTVRFTSGQSPHRALKVTERTSLRGSIA